MAAMQAVDATLEAHGVDPEVAVAAVRCLGAVAASLGGQPAQAVHEGGSTYVCLYMGRECDD